MYPLLYYLKLSGVGKDVNAYCRNSRLHDLPPFTKGVKILIYLKSFRILENELWAILKHPL